MVMKPLKRLTKRIKNDIVDARKKDEDEQKPCR
jgi:hypothetical protein